MGRLIDPGVGELVDRLTILRLKILHGAATPGLCDRFLPEESQVQMRLDRMGHPTSEDTRLLALKLQQVNAKLWHLEDLMAAFAKEDAWLQNKAGCAATAVDIWRMNRERNALIHEINLAAGTPRSAEKF